MKRIKKGYLMSLIFILSGILFFLLNKHHEISYTCVEAHMINSKSGGILLVKVQNQVILLGGAPKPEADEIADYLHKNNIQKIDTLILQEPTELFSGGYEKVMESIPIKKCYVFKNGAIDSYTQKNLQRLKEKGTTFKKYASYGVYKTKGFRVEPFEVKGEGLTATSLLGYNLYLPKLNYMWLPQNNNLSKIDFDNLKKFNPDVINISGIYREALLKKGFLDTIKPKVLILGDGQSVLEQEKQAILQLVPHIQLLDMESEGYIIIYLHRGTYETTTFKKLNSIIL